MIEYFGRPSGVSSIEFTLGDASRKWEYSEGRWQSLSSKKRMLIGGFYEGSIIFGNRFRDTNMNALRTLDRVSEEDIEPADEFVQSNLGIILHNNSDYYICIMYIHKVRLTLKMTLRFSITMTNWEYLVACFVYS